MEEMEYYQNYDVVFKWVSMVFAGETLDVLGVKTGKIIESRCLEPVTLQAKEERIDLLLRDEHGSYYHLEEERNLTHKDMFRFASQHFLVAEQVKTEALTSIIIASGSVTPLKIIETKSGHYAPVIINLTERNGEKRFQEIQKEETPNPVELLFLPLYGANRKSPEEFAREVVLYARELHLQGKITLQFVGAILIMCNKLVSQDMLETIWKEIGRAHV